MPGKLPGADEVGLRMFEQLSNHSGKQRIREMLGSEAPQEKPAEDEFDVAELEALLGPQEG